MPKYFSLNRNNNELVVNIYGDVSSYSEDVGNTLAKEIISSDAEFITVNINSYGGEVAIGLAVYNALVNHKAKVTTHVNGFACSIASVIFMAGDERIMDDASLLMIHNAWTFTSGNADELRKQADDLEIITEASVKAYLSRINIDEDELREMMKDETWISPEDAVEKSFATSIKKVNEQNPSQSARLKVQEIILDRVFKQQTTETEEANPSEDADDEMEVEPATNEDVDVAEGVDDETPPSTDEEEQEEQPEEKAQTLAANLAAFFMAKNAN